MIQVTLYRFGKRVNSTARPTSSTASRTFSCLIRKDSSIITPYLELSAEAQNIHQYNYCYIPIYQRYYFISDIIYSDNVWKITCKIDALASFRYQIGESRQYVLRSASEYNGSVIDTNYPVIVEDTHDVSALWNSVNIGSVTIPDYFNYNIGQGAFVFGLIGENTGGISYYTMQYTPFKNLMNSLMAFTPSDMADVSTGVAKQLADPLQYMTSCYWFPYVPYSSSGRVNSLKFGRFEINPVTAYQLDVSQYKATFTQELTIPRHPDSSSRGKYLSASPYADYLLVFQPYGSMVLKEPDMGSHSRIKLWWNVDFTTGNSYLTVRYSDDANSCLAYQTAQYGIPIRLSQAVVDYLGMGTSIVDGVVSLADGAGSLFSGITSFFAEDGVLDSFSGLGKGISGALHGVSGVSHAIANGLQASAPRVSTTGTQGSFLQQTTPVIYATFHSITDEDNAIFGRPLCMTKRIASLSGYIQVSNPQVSIEGVTERERSLIIQFMANGFYYES